MSRVCAKLWRRRPPESIQLPAEDRSFLRIAPRAGSARSGDCRRGNSVQNGEGFQRPRDFCRREWRAHQFRGIFRSTEIARRSLSTDWKWRRRRMISGFSIPTTASWRDRVEGVEIAEVHLATSEFRDSGQPLLENRDRRMMLVEDSGSRNAKGRNNLSGGILIEEGSTHFEVRDSVSAYWRQRAVDPFAAHSPRLDDGVFAGIISIPSAATRSRLARPRVHVEDNTGATSVFRRKLSMSSTAERRWRSIPRAMSTIHVSAQHIREVDGKCFDLDGFHDGIDRRQYLCQRRPPDAYPFGHFGIVMNNTDPNMQSREHRNSRQHLRRHEVRRAVSDRQRSPGHRQSFLRLNKAECNENAKSSGAFTRRTSRRCWRAGSIWAVAWCGWRTRAAT